MWFISLSITETHEKKCKEELKKSVSQTKSITNMFSAQYNWNKLYYLLSFPISLLFSSQTKSLSYQVVKKVETKFEL